MEKNFWLERWQSDQTGFHLGESNPLLVKHFPTLVLAPAARVFVPLCGKTLDIGWLLAQGCRVVGAELSELAVEQLFAQLALTPRRVPAGELMQYQAENIIIFLGDIFALTAAQLGAVDAVYDRAALVALPEAMRRRYAAHLMAITAKAPQLIICYDYDQQQMPGPPFSVNEFELRQLYAQDYTIEMLESREIPGGLKGQCPAQENVWRLRAGR